MESSAPRVKGDMARLITSTYKSGTICLQFYYHMKGKDIGKLTVYTRESGQGMYPKWSKSGEVGDDWNLGFVSISTRSSYQVSTMASCIFLFGFSITLDYFIL